MIYVFQCYLWLIKRNRIVFLLKSEAVLLFLIIISTREQWWRICITRLVAYICYYFIILGLNFIASFPGWYLLGLYWESTRCLSCLLSIIWLHNVLCLEAWSVIWIIRIRSQLKNLLEKALFLLGRDKRILFSLKFQQVLHSKWWLNENTGGGAIEINSDVLLDW